MKKYKIVKDSKMVLYVVDTIEEADDIVKLKNNPKQYTLVDINTKEIVKYYSDSI